jgi:hypothetical protein
MDVGAIHSRFNVKTFELSKKKKKKKLFVVGLPAGSVLHGTDLFIAV